MDGYIWGHWRCLLYLNFSYSRLNTACQGARQEHRQLRGDTRKWQFDLLRRKLCYDLFFSFLADFWVDSYCALSYFLSVCAFSDAAFNSELHLSTCSRYRPSRPGTMASMLSQLNAKLLEFLTFSNVEVDLYATVLCGRWRGRKFGDHCVMWEVNRVKVWGLGFDRWSCDLEFYFYKSYFNKEKARQQIGKAFWFYRKFSKMYKPEMERILCGIRANNTLRSH